MALLDTKDTDKLINDSKDIVDINLSVTDKKEFRIDGDNNRILKLNTSDLGMISRLQKLYPQLQALGTEAITKLDLDNDDLTVDEMIDQAADAISDIDAEMRRIMDKLFDANVSETCAPSGTMFDPINGKFRFEHIIDVLSGLYESNMQSEIKKTASRIAKHTDKYTKH